MLAEKYNAGLMSQSFWFIEFKKIVGLINEGRDSSEIKAICLDQNLFGAAKAYRAKRMYGYIMNRANTLDAAMVSLFCSSDLATQKLINLITILRLDRLFFEFVYVVYREKVVLGVPFIEDTDVNIFFNMKEAQSEDVAAWKETTTRHLKTNYINYLTDANLLSLVGKRHEITPPILDIALERYLEANHELPILKAITGVS